jgi:hypothetical protein
LCGIHGELLLKPVHIQKCKNNKEKEEEKNKKQKHKKTPTIFYQTLDFTQEFKMDMNLRGFIVSKSSAHPF